jgi:carboxypeptidase C (cathepsin A)
MTETLPRLFETTHTGTFNGVDITYRCLAAETHLPGEDGKPRVNLVSFSYLAEATDPATRPVMFVFNGGPGSASLWLHMGAIGPRIIKVPDAEAVGAGPYTVEHNPLCQLDQTDLVFIDPPGTGYSTVLGETKPADVWGVEADGDVVAQFIKQWLTTHRRWASPRYLCGESYGTTRAVVVAGKLAGGLAGVAFNGIALISTILDFHTARFEKGNPLPDVCYLPTYAATALYHGVISTDLPQDAFLDQVRDFAQTSYLPALFAGSRLNTETYASVRDQLAAFTGLSPAWLDHTRLRIDPARFRKELLRANGLTIGRLDSRYRGTDHDSGGETPEDDPASWAVDSAFVSTANDVFTRTLGVDFDRPYQSFNQAALKGWTWPLKSTEDWLGWPRYLNVAPILAKVLRQNPKLRVLVANGLYDLATPFYAAETSLAGNGIDPARIRLTYYESGHMMYLHDPSLIALMTDLRALVADL